MNLYFTFKDEGNHEEAADVLQALQENGVDMEKLKKKYNCGGPAGCVIESIAVTLVASDVSWETWEMRPIHKLLLVWRATQMHLRRRYKAGIGGAILPRFVAKFQ